MQHAINGLRQTSQGHSNFLVHLTISLAVLLAGVIFGLTSTEWLIIALVITVGLMMELINTAIESVVDLVTLEWRLSAKLAKDAAAAAMLIYALGAAVIGLLIFIPKLLSLLNPT